MKHQSIVYILYCLVISKCLQHFKCQLSSKQSFLSLCLHVPTRSAVEALPCQPVLSSDNLSPAASPNELRFKSVFILHNVLLRCKIILTMMIKTYDGNSFMSSSSFNCLQEVSHLFWIWQGSSCFRWDVVFSCRFSFFIQRACKPTGHNSGAGDHADITTVAWKREHHQSLVPLVQSKPEGTMEPL